jgi:flagellar protein FlaG
MNPQSIRLNGAAPAPDSSVRTPSPAAPVAARSAAVDQLLRQAGANAAGQAAPPSLQQAASAAVEANRWLAEKGSELTLEFDDAVGRTVFRLVDSQTGAVVRQIPSEEVLAIARALADDAPSGALLRTDA